MIDDPNCLNLGVPYVEEETLQYIDLFKQFSNIFSWTYDDIKEYDKNNFYHVIPLKEGVVLVKKNPKMINLQLKLLVKLELE